MPLLPARDRLIVALDFASVAEAEAIVDRLGTAASFYKIGLQLAFADDGLAFAERLAKSGKRVFLDVKLLDIDNTIAGAINSVASMGITFVSVHAYPKAMRAAVKARGNTRFGLLGVTVLTSMDDDDLAAAGYAKTVAKLVGRRAADARAAGMDGVVVAPAEAASARRVLGSGMVIVTPGIRPAGAEAGDQKRAATPEAAVRAGADYLVVGRPITGADDPLDAATAIIAEINRAATASEGQ
ncbi:MAG: orotidine-5'-phosphate decarboxylase [Bauldia sp.]